MVTLLRSQLLIRRGPFSTDRPSLTQRRLHDARPVCGLVLPPLTCRDGIYTARGSLSLPVPTDESGMSRLSPPETPTISLPTRNPLALVETYCYKPQHQNLTDETTPTMYDTESLMQKPQHKTNKKILQLYSAWTMDREKTTNPARKLYWLGDSTWHPQRCLPMSSAWCLDASLSEGLGRGSLVKLHGNRSRSSWRVAMACFLWRYPAIVSRFARSGIETGSVAFHRLGI